MKRKWPGQQAVHVQLACKSSPEEVTSSSTAMVMTPAHSVASTDVGDVDLRFWALILYLNAQHARRGLSVINSSYGGIQDQIIVHGKSDTRTPNQVKLCLVCGNTAHGRHYNALICIGCAGFFRRSLVKNLVYQCKYGNNCKIDTEFKRKCQKCRLKKCLFVGTRPECIVPAVQCVDRILSLNGLKPISPQQEELIRKLIYLQNEYEYPSEEDLKPIINHPTEEDQSNIRFKHITEITILSVQLIVEFAKRLPGFDKLLRDDQVALLKACSSEVMLFRMARRYDVESDSILFANNDSYAEDSLNIAGMGETIENLLRFCRLMYFMKVDNAEYALLTAIIIFSKRPALREGWKVEKIQEIYLEALQAYIDNRQRPEPGLVFANLLSVLTELRTLGNQKSDMCLAFLTDIWDVDDIKM